MSRRQTQATEECLNVRSCERLVTTPRPCRRDHVNWPVTYSECSQGTERHASWRAPPACQVLAHREADLLAKKAQAIRGKAFDLPLEMYRGAELRHADVRCRGVPDRALGGVNQEEATRDEALKVAARPPQFVKDVKETAAQIVRRIGVEMMPVGRWGNADEEDADSARWRDVCRVQHTRRTVHVGIGEARIAAGKAGHGGLKIRPALPHDPLSMIALCAERRGERRVLARPLDSEVMRAVLAPGTTFLGSLIRSDHDRAACRRLLSSNNCSVFCTSYGCSVRRSGSHSLRGTPKKSPP